MHRGFKLTNTTPKVKLIRPEPGLLIKVAISRRETTRASIATGMRAMRLVLLYNKTKYKMGRLSRQAMKGV